MPPCKQSDTVVGNWIVVAPALVRRRESIKDESGVFTGYISAEQKRLEMNPIAKIAFLNGAFLAFWWHFLFKVNSLGSQWEGTQTFSTLSAMMISNISAFCRDSSPTAAGTLQ